MALGTTPTLTEINTELGTTGQSLATCISNAGKSGVWDRQSDFANYSAGYISYSNLSSSTLLPEGGDISLDIDASDPWSVDQPPEVSSVVPSSGTAGTTTGITITVEPNETGADRVVSVKFYITDNSSIYTTVNITQGG